MAVLASQANATVVNPSPTGGDDTANIQNVCNAGQFVELIKGTYHVSSVTCKDIVGKDPANRCYFWYEGVACPTTMVGIGTAGEPMIICPSSGCAYKDFAMNLPPGAAGIGIAQTVHGLSVDGMLIADVGSGQSGSCIDMTGGQNNQELVISNTTLIHCGAGTSTSWCINAGVTSDSSIVGDTIIANCGAGGVLVSFGYGWDFRFFRCEAQYTGPCIDWEGGGDGTIDVGGFDINLYDIQLGSVYLTLGNVLDSRLAPGGVSTFNIVGQAALIGGHVFTAGPTFHVDPSVTSFYACGQQIVGLSTSDPYSQQVVSTSVVQNCQ